MTAVRAIIVVALGMPSCAGAVAPLAFSTPEGTLSAYASSKQPALKYELEEWPKSSDAKRNWTAAEKVKLTNALASTWDTVTSSEFQNRVGVLTNLHEGTDGPAIAGPFLLNVYLTQRLPVIYEKSQAGGETADTGVHDKHALMKLGSSNLERWADGDDVDAKLRRACLVNTLAHEWIHTIPAANGSTRFTDDGHNRSAVPLVSYSIGSIAHCVYLERANVIQPAKFWACVNLVGTRTFSGLSVCEQSKWLSSL